MEEGFLRLNRKFFSNELWKEARVFSECEAWLDLIQSARFEATDKAYSEHIGGREISYSRGQYPASISFLKKRWRWSDKKVRYFLAKMKKKGMITICNTQGMNVITLCNFEEYNPIKGKHNGIDNYLGNNEIDVLLGKLRGKMLEDIQKMGQAKGNKKKKEEETKIKESNTDVLPKKEDSVSYSAHINYQKIKDDYNTMFTGKLPAVSTLTDKRKSAIRARISEHGIDSVQRVFDNVFKSPFLLGCNNRNWKCNFDWIFAPTNFLKILEGNYIQHGQVDYTTEIRAYSTSDKAASRDALEKEANRILQQFATEDS